MEFLIKSIEDTKALAEKMAEVLKKGDILCLEGDLGAGKTTFTQYLLRAFGVDDYITSPTFNIVNTYQGRVAGEVISIHHFDVYRISHYEEMYDIGYEEYVDGESIAIIEWPSRIMPLLPKEAIFLNLTLGDNEERHAQITGLKE